ncbi:hypothetical protein IWQ60_007555 [Tieghemiomyces parasiticus]|uniref:TOG domain-containing protein n=1 Tax=Tieghemiomyces parasiticus TaxID=78921 RepID=A0A9W8A1T2_9FUNG|nr:hypothetical protein IWQ60_007555 [Tieghemiomyces parasiticus]
MATADDETANLPLDTRLVHKVWKVRLEAYKQLERELNIWDPQTDGARFYDIGELAPKLAGDTNMIAQESGITALVTYLRMAPDAPRTRETVLPILIDKGLASTRAGTRTQTLEAVLMYVELDVAEPVVEALLPGLGHKQPKMVAATVTALREILTQFGAKTTGLKPVLKALPKMFGHADGNVRTEAQKLVVEIYRWIRAAVEPFLAELKPVQVADLKTAFEAVPADPATASRLLRSQQALVVAEAMASPAADSAPGPREDADDGADPSSADMDPYQLADPVDVLAKLPADFEALLKSSKWKERKEALEGLHAITNTIRLAVGPYEPLVGHLAKHVNDTNIIVATVAVTCIEGMARGLRTDFAPYKPTVVPALIEKCKEKKATVITAIRGALDAILASTDFDLQAIVEDVVVGSDHKNPQVKAESLRWMVRALQKIPVSPPKKDLPDLTKLGLKGLDDGNTDVRDTAADLLGHLMKCVGEPTLKLFLGDLDKIKEAKVMESFEQATVVAKVARPKPPPPAASRPGPPARLTRARAPAPSASPAAPRGDDLDALAALAPAAKPMLPPKLRNRKPPGASAATGSTPATPAAKPTPKAPVAKPKPAGAAGAVRRAPAPAVAKPDEPIRYKYTEEALADLIPQHIPAGVLSQLNESNWKTRLAGMEALIADLRAKPAEDVDAEVVVRQMLKKPGVKEVNFQVAGQVYQLLQFLAQDVPSFGRPAAALAIPLVAEKLGDLKLKKPAAETLELFAESLSLGFVLSQAYGTIAKQKAPKVLAETMTWIGSAAKEFGVGAGLNVRALIECLKTVGLNSSNAQARSTAISVMVTLCQMLGPNVLTLVQDINAKTLELVEAEYAKVKDEPAPMATRGPAVQQADGGADGTSSSAAAGGGGAAREDDLLDDLLPRVDLAPQFNAKLTAKLRDDNWKLRKEGLETIQAALASANQRIQPTVGDVWAGLKPRLADSNKNLVVLTCEIVGQLATAMGRPFEKQCRLILTPLLHVLTDKKPQVRTAGLAALTAIADACGSLDPILPASGIALAGESPTLRKDLLDWLVGRCAALEALPPAARPDLTPLVGGNLDCLEDRNVEVRKVAQAAIKYVVQSVGYAAVRERVMAAKGNSRAPLLAAIEPYQGASGGVPAPATSAPSANSVVPAKRASASGSSPTKLTKAQLFSRREGGPPPSAAPSSAAESGGLRRAVSTLGSSGPGAAAAKPLNPRLSLRRKLGGVAPRVPLGNMPGGASSGRATPSPTTASLPTAAAALHPDEVPLILTADPRSKELRRRKEAGLTKWAPDQTTQLISQMEPHFNPRLLQQLFSTDHHKDRDYFQALGALDEGLTDAPRFAALYRLSEEDWTARYVCHLDLILKYLTVRFQDTLTTTWMRCLDFLEHLVAFLDDQRYQLSDYEAAVFLPYFIGKFGDPKEAIRARVTALFRRLGRLRPVSLMFQALVDYGLRSKNAKIRAEVLEELAALIQRNGLAVCTSPPRFVPLIASYISERDAHARTAALNVLVQVYQQTGDAIYGLVGRLNEKDRSMLEERLKRTQPPAHAVASPAPAGSTIPRRLAGPDRSGSRLLPPRSGLPVPSASGADRPASRLGLPPSRARPVSMMALPPEHTDPATIAPAPASATLPSFGGDADHPGPRRTKEFSLDFDRLNLPTVGAASAANRRSRPQSLMMSSGGGSSARPAPVASRGANDEPHQAYMLDVILAQITSTDSAESQEAMRYLDKLRHSEAGIRQLVPQIDSFIHALTLQLRLAFALSAQAPGQLALPAVDAGGNYTVQQRKLCHRVVQCCILQFQVPELARAVSTAPLQGALQETLRCLRDPRLEASEENSPLLRALNVLATRILENGNRNRVYAALFTTLGEACEHLPPESDPQSETKGMYANLAMKCIWKLSKKVSDDMHRDLIRVDEFLASVNDFFVRWPEELWTRRQADGIKFGNMPYRSVKSVLYDLVQLAGTPLNDVLGLIPDVAHSPLYRYLQTIEAVTLLPVEDGSTSPASSTATLVARDLDRSPLTRPRPLDLSAPVPPTNLASVSDTLGQLRSRLQQRSAELSGGGGLTTTAGAMDAPASPFARPRPLSMYGVPNQAEAQSPEAHRRTMRQLQERLGYHRPHTATAPTASAEDAHDPGTPREVAPFPRYTSEPQTLLTPSHGTASPLTYRHSTQLPTPHYTASPVMASDYSATHHINGNSGGPSTYPAVPDSSSVSGFATASATSSSLAPQLRPMSTVQGSTVEDLRARLAQMKSNLGNLGSSR